MRVHSIFDEKGAKEEKRFRGTWVAQLVKHLTLDFGSGHDPRALGLSSGIRFCAELGACLDETFSLSLSLSLSLF